MLRTTAAITGGQGGAQWSQMYFGGDTVGEAGAAAAAAREFWNQMDGFLHSSYVINIEDDVDRVDVATGDILESFSAPTATVTCTGAGDPLPWATQGLIRWRTGVFVAGRELRGRLFVPGWLESASTSGDPTAAATAAQDSAANAFLIAAAPAGGFGVYSPTHRVFSAVTSHSSWSKWAILRSRRQ